jgi:pantoate--beta-alanine ligase
MKIVRDIASLRVAAAALGPLAFVPTMGSLHPGHVSLVRLARRQAAAVAVSIFVNRLQFAPSEDFERYPRSFEEDRRLLEAEGVELLFAPAEEVLYPRAQSVIVHPGPLGEELEGRFRPGFFQGVATVVLKLLNAVRPAAAVFGKKDYQQLVVLREMVRQLDLPVDIVAGETARDADGLAMSSRNAYLSPDERKAAPMLHRVITGVADAAAKRADAAAAIADGKAALTAAGFKLDYLEVRDAETLQAVAPDAQRPLRVLVAAWLGKTRLIDNVGVGSRAR